MDKPWYKDPIIWCIIILGACQIVHVVATGSPILP